MKKLGYSELPALLENGPTNVLATDPVEFSQEQQKSTLSDHSSPRLCTRNGLGGLWVQSKKSHGVGGERAHLEFDGPMMGMAGLLPPPSTDRIDSCCCLPMRTLGL